MTIVAWFFLLSVSGLSRAEAHRTLSTLSATRASYLYRYDPVAQSFLTIPLASNAMPIGVAVTGTNPMHVWIAESNLNRIAHVTFTNTADYTQTAYSITTTTNSQPYRIAVRGNDVWFTERTANRVGRLDATTGQLDEFYGHGLSLNAGLSDIKVAKDGAVWIGGQTVQRLIKLTVDLPDNYSFVEYSDWRPSFMMAPAFFSIGDDDEIWLTVPESTYYPIAQFTPATGAFVWLPMPIGSQPQGVVVSGGYAWYADRGGNAIAQAQWDTTPRINLFGSVIRPVEIAAASPTVMWVTQADDWGSIARFVYTSTVSFQIASIALPQSGLHLGGIAVASDGSVWVVAQEPLRLYLPLIRRNS
jgi:streptogramin lyase